MTSFTHTRRSFLGLALTTAAVAAWGPSLAAGGPEIRMFWWGGNDRAKRTQDAIAAFEQANADIAVTGEFAGWDSYWTRLATQVAGGNAPDLIQMDPAYLVEYARRGVILPLDGYIGKTLDIADFGQGNLASCSVDGKVYGVNNGINTFCLFLDAGAFKERGVEPPTFDTTWAQLAEKCVAFAAKNTKKDFYAITDGSQSEWALELWLRAQGKALYTADGKLAYQPADLAGWFQYWTDLRNAGGCVPADVQALSKDSVDTSPLTLGYAAADFAFSNQFIPFTQLNKAPLSIVNPPAGAAGEKSNYYRPSQMFSVTSGSKNPEAAVALANFLVKKPEGVKALGLERGVPASPAMRDFLLPSLSDAEKETVQFLQDLAPYAAATIPPAPPAGDGEIANLLSKVSQEVGFGVTDPQKGADSFFSDANAILTRT